MAAAANGGLSEDQMVQLDDKHDETNVHIFENFLMPRSSNKRENTHSSHVPSDDTDLLIDAINSMNIGWKADKCKLQKSHQKHPGRDCERVTLA